jgi:hypothetical protein
MDREETAAVLLDLLSAPDGAESINAIPLAPGASKAALVGSVLGTLAAHEIGHLLGAWDTDTVKELLDPVMDAGGELAELIGVGGDGVWGSEDDRLTYWHIDLYAPDGAYGLFYGMQSVDVRVVAGLGGFAPDPGDPGDGQLPNVGEVDAG